MKKILMFTLCLIGLYGSTQAANQVTATETSGHAEISANQDLTHLTLRISQDGEFTVVDIWSNKSNGGVAYVHNSGKAVYPMEIYVSTSAQLYLLTSEVGTLSIERFEIILGQSVPFTWEYYKW